MSTPRDDARGEPPTPQAYETPAAPALELRGLVKQYGGVQALRGASLSAARGTVHGLIGQNGAGKSTLIKILAGLERADAGEIRVDGVKRDGGAPGEIAFIHQERLLSPTFTVAEALALGDEPRVPGLRRLRALRSLLPLDLRRMRRRASEALAEHFDIALPPDRLIGELSVAEQQIVQITRALMRAPRILVFDEPTAALVSREVERLLQIIDRLRARGLTILYVSHYLNEIASLCDRVTVLRDGIDVAQVDARTTPVETLVEAMIGTPPAARARRVSNARTDAHDTQNTHEAVLEARDLHAPGRFGPLSFALRRGEVLGVTGLVGSGGKPLVRSLFGLERGVLGELRLNGKRVRLRRPADAVRRGIAFVPEDRRRQGVATALPVRENLSLASLARFSRFGLVDTRRETAAARALIDTLGVRTPGPHAPVRHLSGGNQQKVALGKWLGRAQAGGGIYILDEPTVGVDVGAKADIYRLIDELVAQGASVLIFSSDLHELLDVTDRVLVLARGAIVQDVGSQTASTQDLLAWATLARRRAGAAPTQENAA
ncbi:sugar ABC transporter ATP-binding protein [Paraburkholderia tropica]|uniref:Monosaccharide ABC transporter ATP-binding protein, CUT2 family n=1 Tax=Paraburkholderia tropica TaxID=92647 RepID=A0AAQ1JVU8_9BURK|nr:sugar ABC transporter ATP-binding protein [Paraburkholderia tropica]RQN37527.1 sugar ABC transporter ATP-binding protein [Paraburkholderia tropica]SEK01119.1 monosaccharide ABC transporter ATP-binding protein, CUT2 family [Paraburkholderia tropica]